MMMASFTLAELAQGIAVDLIGFSAKESLLVANKINTDTRTIEAGDIFLALRGDHFDGHDYLDQAEKSGAVAAIVDQEYVQNKNLLNSALPLLVVADTLLTLGRVSLWNREKFTAPLIAITGSAGKTSVKSMAAHLMQLLGPCWSTPGNFNNHIGVPLTLLGLSSEHRAGVIELGASSEGEIAYSSQFAKPDIAVITNVSGAHLEGFGSIETIMRTKGEIIDSLRQDGCVVLNADDVFYTDWLLRAGERKVISFAIEHDADVMAKNIICDEQGSRFDLVYQQQSFPCMIPLLGQHNVSNALSVIAAGLAVNLELTAIVTQLMTMPAVEGRLQWVDGIDGIRIINDSYNASPASVKAGIDVLALWKEKAWLVLGDMAELGEDSAAIHAEMGEYAKQAGIANLLAIGKDCRYAVDVFKQGAVKQSAHWFQQQSELLKYINDNKQPGQIFLVKGSRSSGMDKVVTALSLKSENSVNSTGEV
jgi:UDP-N-acetylmuramoyl-tripeptide--D-alanyl-D-alanine ligase